MGQAGNTRKIAINCDDRQTVRERGSGNHRSYVSDESHRLTSRCALHAHGATQQSIVFTDP